MKRVFTALLFALCFVASAAEVMPPSPADYFNDYANVVSPATARRLDATLESFEKQTSSQVVVAIFPKMQSESSMEDYTVRIFKAWKVGQKSKNNGVVLFVFVQDRKLRIEVGYGLEGALPDALCKRIIEDDIKPGFKTGNYDAGLIAGVNAILAATKGEYKGPGRTAAQPIIITGSPAHRLQRQVQNLLPLIIVAIFFLLIIVSSIFGRRRRGRYYGSDDWSDYDRGGGGWYSSGGSSGWSSGGGSSGGGGFSGGGGSSGGGGASGSW